MYRSIYMTRIEDSQKAFREPKNICLTQMCSAVKVHAPEALQPKFLLPYAYQALGLRIQSIQLRSSMRKFLIYSNVVVVCTAFASCSEGTMNVYYFV
jgi:hypothetical protein